MMNTISGFGLSSADASSTKLVATTPMTDAVKRSLAKQLNEVTTVDHALKCAESLDEFRNEPARVPGQVLTRPGLRLRFSRL